MDSDKENENVGHKIDRINEVISNLMKEFEYSHIEFDKFSMISPVESFCDDFADYSEPFLDISLDTHPIPQDFLDKFQENLTEIDRLKMIIEDMTANLSRPCEFLHEILINKRADFKFTQ